MKPGEPLNEALLASELKASTTPLREAMQQLQKEGFVENLPGRGSFVSRISTKDVRELFEIREILECQVIRPLISQGLVVESRARAIRKEFESSKGKGRPRSRGYFTPGDQIHLFVFESFGNSRLLEYYRSLHEHIERMRLFFFSISMSNGPSGPSRGIWKLWTRCSRTTQIGRSKPCGLTCAMRPVT